MTPEDFTAPFLRLELHYPQRAASDQERLAFRRSWYDLVKELDADAWQRIVGRLLIQERQFMPTPGEALALAEPVALEREAEQRRLADEQDTQRRLADGHGGRNPRAREITEAIRAWRRMLGQGPQQPFRPTPADYDAWDADIERREREAGDGQPE